MALPSEALPATVLEIDETEKGAKEQPRINQSENHIQEIYNGGNITLRTKKQSKGSSLSVSKSDDLVDEELGNMEQAESLDVLSSSVSDNYNITIYKL